jgi:hypothetical protein
MRARTHWVAWWRKRGGRAAYHPRAHGAAKMAGENFLAVTEKGGEKVSAGSYKGGGGQEGPEAT